MLSKETRKIRQEVRLHILENNGKNVDSQGVVKRLRRQVRKGNNNG